MAMVVFNAAFRLPVMFAAANGMLMLGEVARRAIAKTIHYAMNTQDRGVSANSWKDKMFTLCCPFHEASADRLLVGGVASVAIGAVGWELVNWGLSPLPPQYNQVMRYLGPLVLDKEWRHPMIAAPLRWIGKA